MDIHIELAAEELFSIGPLAVTNSMLLGFIVMIVILVVFITTARRAKEVPGRFQCFIELIMEFLLGMTEGAGGKAFGRKVFPLVSALFIFILLANYTGLLPGVGTIGRKETVVETSSEGEAAAVPYTVASAGTTDSDGVALAYQDESTATEEEHETLLVPFLRAPTADINTTLALALVSFTAIQVLGIRAHGVRGRLKHMADPVFLFPIEVISELSRIISLSARLFGNVFAGEALLAVMYAITAKIGFLLIPVLIPVVFLFLELMFGTIQALVFAMLTLVYVAIAAAHVGEHEHDEVQAAVPTTSSAGD